MIDGSTPSMYLQSGVKVSTSALDAEYIGSIPMTAVSHSFNGKTGDFQSSDAGSTPAWDFILGM